MDTKVGEIDYEFRESTMQTGCSHCVALKKADLCRSLCKHGVAMPNGYWRKKHVTTETSKQVGGSHYLKAIQPWDIIEAWDMDFWEGNALKYLLRYKEKGGLQDLDKLQHYLDKIRSNYANTK